MTCLCMHAEIASTMTKALHFNTCGGNPIGFAVGSSLLDVRLQLYLVLYLLMLQSFNVECSICQLEILIIHCHKDIAIKIEHKNYRLSKVITCVNI